MSQNNPPESGSQPPAESVVNPDLYRVDPGQRTFMERVLNNIEVVGNKLPDPAVLFFILLIITWFLSWALANVDFAAVHPQTGETIRVINQLGGHEMASFLANMVRVFVNFAPLGVVLVALLGVGVAEHSGFVNAALRRTLGINSVSMPVVITTVLALAVVAAPLEYLRRFRAAETEAAAAEVMGPFIAQFSAVLALVLGAVIGFILLCRFMGMTSKHVLTPLVVLVGVMSSTAVDAGYVVVVPLGAVIFYAAGRHPLAGIAAAFAGVSGGFSANFIPSALDPMLAGITQEAAQVIEPGLMVNPLVNWIFMSASCLLIVAAAWWLTDRIIEPRLMKDTPVDGDMEDQPSMEELDPKESRGLRWAGISIIVGILLLIAACVPEASPLRDQDGELGSFNAPLMQAIVPFIFLFFLIPGIVYGYVVGTFKGHKDIIEGMTKAMSSMGYYIVMAFFAAQFIAAFSDSNIGLLLAMTGAGWLEAMALPAQLTIIGIILLTVCVNIFVGSASAKWLIIAPIFVPMLMQHGISPELTQAAYRIGDSASNIITPLLPYFPLIVVFCRRYYTSSGIGTLISLMLPYSIVLGVIWTVFLMLFWWLGIPLGLQANYVYPPPG